MIARYTTLIVRYLSLHIWPCLLWTLLILTACLMPPSGMPKTPFIPGLDKIVHIVLFAIWSFLLAGYTRSTALMVLLTGFALGTGIEFLQEALAMGRSFEWWDVAADVSGVVLGYLVRMHLIPACLPETRK